MKKEIRQNAIKKIISERRVKTQDELISWLKLEGFEVGQSTISRDIRELNLTKVNGIGSDSFYVLKEKEKEYKGLRSSNQYNLLDNFENSYESRIRNVFHDSVLSVDSAYFLIIIHTLPGMAQAAAHLIDLLKIDEVAGTIAGDDTIFVAVKRERDIDKLKKIFLDLLNQ